MNNRGRAQQIVLDGMRVHTIEWTPRPSGNPSGAPSPALTEPTRAEPTSVVLVHGLGANALSWELVAQPLADRLGATVTALDLLGFGRTRSPERASTIDANRKLVTALLERQPGPSILVGNSMGGAISIAVTAHRPELVDALVLIDPAVPHPNPGVGDWARLAKLAPVMVQSFGTRVIGTRARFIGPERLVDTSLAWSLHEPARLDPDLRRRLITLAAERFAYPEAAGAYACAARSMFLYLARGLNDDLAVASSHCPTLIVHGEHDRLVSLAAARGAADRHPAVDLHVLDGIGHAPQLEAPDLLVEVVTGWLGARMGGWQGQDRAPVSSTSPSGSSSTS